MSLHVLANHMASRGRGNDSMLVHMTPHEVAGLQALAMKHGGSLTINPDTGLPEAGFLSSILPMIAGFALGPAGFGLVESALGAGAIVGGATGLATGSLSKGLMAGLGAYGGFGIGESLVGLGASKFTPEVLANAGRGADPIGALASSAAETAAPTGWEAAKAGMSTAMNNPSSLVNQMGGGMNAAKTFGMAAAPIIADQMVPTTVKAPPMPPAYIRPYQYDANTRTVTAQTPVLASEWGTRSFPQYIPKTPGGMASGGIVALADGGETDPYAKYNTLSGQSKAAYDYLMGNASYPQSQIVTPRTVTLPPAQTTPTETPPTQPPAETPVTVTPPTVVTPPQITEPPYVEPPVSEPPVSEPPVVQPPVVTPTPTVGTGETGIPSVIGTGGTGVTTTTPAPSGQEQTGTGTVPGSGGASTTGGATGVETLLPGAGGSTSTGTSGAEGSTSTAGGIPTLVGSSGVEIPTTTPATTPGASAGAPIDVPVTLPATLPQEPSTGVPVDVPVTRGIPDLIGGGGAPAGAGEVGGGEGPASSGNETSPEGEQGTGQQFTPATDLGGGLYAVDNPDGTQSIFTEEGSYVGATGGNNPEEWEGNKIPTGVPNVSWGSSGLNPAGFEEESGIGFYPDTPEQQQKVDEYMRSQDNGGAGFSANVGSDIFENPNGFMDYTGGAPMTAYDMGNLNLGGGSNAFDRYIQATQEAANGGLMGYANGGLGTLGGYSDGGRLLKGPGDGVSDSIPATIGQGKQPARLADGEFVVPARIVSELGNGSTEAGARKLYAMMDRIQKARGKTVGKGKVATNSRADKHLPA